MARTAHARRQVLPTGALVTLVMVAAMPPSLAQTAPAAAGPLERGMVFVRIQGPSAAIRHQGISGRVRVKQAVMLDDPVQTPQPLLLERLEVDSAPWLLLTRQLSVRHLYQGSRYRSIQALQVLSAERLSPGPLQLVASLPQQPRCAISGQQPDGDIVALRFTGTFDRQLPEFTDLQRAWRLNRRTLRLAPLDPAGLRCSNPGQGVP